MMGTAVYHTLAHKAAASNKCNSIASGASSGGNMLFIYQDKQQHG